MRLMIEGRLYSVTKEEQPVGHILWKMLRRHLQEILELGFLAHMGRFTPLHKM